MMTTIRKSVLLFGVMLSFIMLQPSVLRAQGVKSSLRVAEERLNALLDESEEIQKNMRYDEAYEVYYQFEKEFENLLMSDPNTFYYSFPLLKEKGLNIVESSDRKLRMYNYFRPNSGSMLDYFNAHQYESDGVVYSRKGSICNAEDYKEKIATSEDCASGGYVDDCFVIPIAGKPCYFVKKVFTGSSRASFPSLSAYSIVGGEIQHAEVFKTQSGELVDFLSFWYDHQDWYNRADNTDRGKWIWYYDGDSKTIYCPISADEDLGILSDQYEKYRLNNNCFEYVGKDGGSWLNPTIRKFISLETLFTTKRYIVRIDKVKEGVYRYCSWKNTKTMAEEPDIVLTGTFDRTYNKYSFTGNGKIWYYVKLGDWGDNVLTVQQGDKVLLRQEEILQHNQ